MSRTRKENCFYFVKEPTGSHLNPIPRLVYLSISSFESSTYSTLCSVMSERLAENGRQYESDTMDHVNEYADAGLRTLLLAYRELDEEEYNKFSQKFNEAKNSISADRDALIDEATDIVEKDLILLGATAVEDKLQNGVMMHFNHL